jgi:tRNA A37 methylthiotransferase MiaB
VDCFDSVEELETKTKKEVEKEVEEEEEQEVVIVKTKRQISDAQREHLNKIRELAMKKKTE